MGCAMKKFCHILFTAAFFITCLIPAAGLIFLGPSEAAGNEVLSPVPRTTNPDGSFNLDLLPDAADWFSDHFAFRQELVTADSAMKSALFHTSAQPDVTLGQDGWLYYTETLDDFTGADLITQRQAWCAARSLALAQRYVEERGGVFTFTIAPNKISLYPQFAPSGLAPADATSAGLLRNQLELQEVHYTDLFEPFLNQNEVLYHKLDSHWTNKGAALGHDLLLAGLGLEGNAYEKDGTYQLTHRGDLYEMLYPASNRLDKQFEFNSPLEFEYASPIRGADDLRIMTSSGSQNEPLVMFRDSFGNALHSLMAGSFSSAVFSRAMPYNLALMDQTAARYVVVEIVERNLDLLARTPFLMPAPQAEFTEEASPTDAAAEAESSPAANLPGFVQINGKVDSPCDTDSPVYVRSGGIVYEAFPVADSEESGTSFGLCLPEGSAGDLQVIFRSGSRWLTAQV